MSAREEKLKKVREEIIEKRPKELRKRVAIVFDGRQYNLRIPKDFAIKAGVNPEMDEFEFQLFLPEPDDEFGLPVLVGELVEKKEDSERQGENNT